MQALSERRRGVRSRFAKHTLYSSCLASISSSGGMFLALLTVAVTASAAHCAAPVMPFSCDVRERSV